MLERTTAAPAPPPRCCSLSMARAVTLVLLQLAAFATASAGAGAAGKQYNVLYFVADDLRPEMAAAAYGQKQALTPNIDKMAAGGLTFAHSYCQQAVCGPSRNSFMTGRRPHRTNVMGLYGRGQDFRQSGSDVNGPGSMWITMPEHFKQHNFSTLGGGKTFHPGDPPNFDYPTSWDRSPTDPESGYFSFSYFLASQVTKTSYHGICPGECDIPGKGGSCTPAGETNATGGSLAGPIAVWCALDEPDEHFYDQGLGTDTIGRLKHAGEQRASAGTPFFIQSGFARPHTPWRVPQRFWDMYKTSDIVLAAHKLPPPDMPGVAWMPHSFFNSTNGHVWPLNVTLPLPDNVQQLARQAYLASVSWVDHQIGRVLTELDSLGLAEETITLLHGDHGWQLGEHNSWHKYTNFELGVRVPLIIRAPMFPASVGKICYGLAELVDVYPTLAELSNSGPPAQVLDGVSLAPFFEDPTRTTFPTPASKGVMDKTLAFSQYPHSATGSGEASCPFYFQGECYNAPHGDGGGGPPLSAPQLAAETVAAAAAAAGKKPQSSVWMGYSVRNATFRYTGWVPHDGTVAQWDQAVRTNALFFEELYGPYGKGNDFDSFDTANLAYKKEYEPVRDAFFLLTKEFFKVVVPPSPIAPPPPPKPKACGSWCAGNTSPWSAKCKWAGCSLCPECRQ